jgi:glutamyl-tRNA synthetase
MHVGNLRTALFEYLIAKAAGGVFVLRIEDTDQERQVEGAEQVIYDTLQRVGLVHDEGPDVGGPYAPYVQSQRRHLYRPYAEQLVAEGKAYRCFCTRERLESLRADADGIQGYDRHCRDLPAQEVERLLTAGTPHVMDHESAVYTRDLTAFPLAGWFSYQPIWQAVVASATID